MVIIIKLRILGKRVEINYEVTETRDEFNLFIYKPILHLKEKVLEWIDLIPEIDNYTNKINDDDMVIMISKDKSVNVEDKEFHAYINTYMYYTDEIVEKIELNKSESEEKLKLLIKEYNKTTIENNKILLNYCKSNALVFEDTDVNELIIKLKTKPYPYVFWHEGKSYSVHTVGEKTYYLYYCQEHP